VAKVRVHELAKEFGVESKVVLAKLGEMGEFVKSASSTVEPPVVKRFTDKFGDELKSASDKKAAKKALQPYDSFVAEAPMMPTVGRVAGPILGPRGKMPTPVPPQAPIDNVIERERKTVVLRSRDKPFIHCIVGKENMSDDEVAQNIEAVVQNLTRATKRGFANIRSIYLKLSMGDSVKVF